MQIPGPTGIEDLQNIDMLDAIVIGAGPAGSSVAIQLARRGYSILLVEKQHFPRDKVCGSCLSGRAIASLHQLELTGSLEKSIPLTEFVLATAGRQVRLTCEGGRAISRRRFDTQLARLATEAGAQFLPGTKASPGVIREDYREVILNCAGRSRQLRTRLVLICAGLGKAAADAWQLSEQVSPNSRIGLTTYLRNELQYPPGRIYMCVDRTGYLGLTTLEDGRLNLSACVDRQVLRSSSPTDVATHLIRQAGLTLPNLSSEQRWMGTSSLTRLECPAGNRLFALGDAAGYVEPFTGEGIGWALQASQDIQVIAEQAIAGWDDSLIQCWRRKSRKRQARQQMTCSAIKFFARRPFMVASTVATLRVFPALASPVIRAIHKS